MNDRRDIHYNSNPRGDLGVGMSKASRKREMTGVGRWVAILETQLRKILPPPGKAAHLHVSFW